MKFNIKSILAAGFIMASLQGVAQDRAAVLADIKLATMEITDFSGHTLDVSNLQADQLVKLKLPVSNDNHGKALPAGSCKIKIGLGSKLLLDPGFDLNNAGASNYFVWSAVEEGGQVQITGELVNALPANITHIDLSFRLKVKEEGASAITANFLISNHNSVAVLSDEDGANNAAGLSYKVNSKIPADPSAPAGKLKLNLYPNPVKDVNTVKISVVQGQLLGKYRINMYDMAGKIVQSKEMQLDFVSSFMYNFGSVASGKYIIKVLSATGAESAILKMEKF